LPRLGLVAQRHQISTPTPIEDPETNQIVTLPKEKARIFSSQYDHQKENIPDDPRVEKLIKREIRSTEPNALNSLITSSELEHSLRQLQSRSMGRDLIHNQMITNLSEKNKMHLLHLFNNILQTHYVPTDWKTATVIPIQKPDKPAEKPESYRPISLTSCLGKVMERIVHQRLSWSFETKGIRLKTQCGFRKRKKHTG
jgi:hypothetical protein